MKKIFFLSALTLLTIFTACNKEELAENFVPVDDQLVNDNIDKQGVNAELAGQAVFTVDNEHHTLSEGGELLLTNNSVNAVSYHWDFGNGDTSTEANPNYKNYTIHGPRTITLTVTDELGHTSQASQEVTVLCVFGGGNHSF